MKRPRAARSREGDLLADALAFLGGRATGVDSTASSSAAPLVGELGLAAPSVPVPAGLKQRLFDRISAETDAAASHQPDGSFFPKPGVFGVRTNEAPWTPTPLPGIEMKILFCDAEKGSTTKLVRFEPGTRYPMHRHAGREEIYVIEGSLRVNGVLLGPGDYCRSEPGTEETGTFSETGGLALLVSCDRDEMVL